LSVDDRTTLPGILKDLAALGEPAVETGRAIICVVGEGMRGTPGIAARIFATIRDINVSLISLGASRINVTFVVEESRAAEAVRRLHAALFARALEPVSWRALSGRRTPSPSGGPSWTFRPRVRP